MCIRDRNVLMHIFVKGTAIKFGRILDFHDINLFVDQVSPHSCCSMDSQKLKSERNLIETSSVPSVCFHLLAEYFYSR